MIGRREFITLLGGATAWPLAARAQRGERMRRGGMLMSGGANDPEGQTRMIAFVQGLAQLGWTDGRDVRPARAALAARDRVIENGPPAGSDISSKAWTEWHLYVVNDALTNFNRIGINTLATAARLPTIHGVREAVEAGGLMSYGADVSDLFRRAGNIVDKILRGMRPSDIPVEQPTKFDLVINLLTAKALGLTVPPTLLSRADEVIE